MIISQSVAPKGNALENSRIVEILTGALTGKFTNQKIVVLVPDQTRSLPLPFLFKTLVEILHDTARLDFLVALGTHPALTNEEMNHLFGVTDEERETIYKNIGLINHSWDQPSSLVSIGTIEKDKIKQIARDSWHDSLPEKVDVTINKSIFSYDQILIVGPTFPHEVVGFSGGAKYIFPGISGPEMINSTHWLAALAGVVKTIGVKNTPVREMIHYAVSMLQTPITLVGCLVEGHDLSGLVIGDVISAWSTLADLSAERHIHWCDKPYQRVLSAASSKYDELWTAGKAMYKLEPSVAVGGELIIYAPHLDTISRVHGKYLYEIGYHTLPYFLHNWDKFKEYPLGVLAHSTHVRGGGVWENGTEKPNVHVILSSKVSAEDCARLNLGYLDPSKVKISDWENKEGQGILYVPNAGEELFRVK